MALVGAAGEGPREETPDLNPPAPQGEKTAVQKRTYTRWMNVFLKRVYRFRPSTHRIFRLNNIAKALAFLNDRHVKLLGVEASAVADGVPHVVLNLLWNIISFFQIQEATGGLKRRLSSSSPSPSPSPRGPLPPPGGPSPSPRPGAPTPAPPCPPAAGGRAGADGCGSRGGRPGSLTAVSPRVTVGPSHSRLQPLCKEQNGDTL
ncbi:unnamed protein product [Arctogadus glacialis]